MLLDFLVVPANDGSMEGYLRIANNALIRTVVNQKCDEIIVKLRLKVRKTKFVEQLLKDSALAQRDSGISLTSLFISLPHLVYNIWKMSVYLTVHEIAAKVSHIFSILQLIFKLGTKID